MSKKNALNDGVIDNAKETQKLEQVVNMPRGVKKPKITAK